MTELLPPYVEVDLDAFALAHDAGAVVLDVREPVEFEQYRVPGVIAMPMGTVPDRCAEVATDVPVYVICAHGTRSAQVTQFLRAQGVDARNVAGGTEQWAGTGRPLEHGVGSTA
jgi:rhodanese-related sulfurtransferase